MTGTIPSQYPTASHGASSTSERASISWAITGVITIPPTDNPVDAIDNAIERFTWNHRVTRLVAGTSPARAYPAPYTKNTANICHVVRISAINAIPIAATVAPTTITALMSKRLMRPPA